MDENNEILDEGFIELVGTIFTKPRKLTLDELKAMGIEVVDVTEADLKKAKNSKIDLDKITHPTKVISDTVVGKLSNKFNIRPENIKRALALSGIVLVTAGTLSLINGIKAVKAKNARALELTEEEYNAVLEARQINYDKRRERVGSYFDKLKRGREREAYWKDFEERGKRWSDSHGLEKYSKPKETAKEEKERYDKAFKERLKRLGYD